MGGTATANRNRLLGEYASNALLSIIGFGCSTATVLLAVYTPIFSTAQTDSPIMQGITRSILFAFMLLGFLILTKALPQRERLVRSPVAKATAASLMLALPSVVLVEHHFGFEAPLAVTFTSWGLFGLAGSFYACSWADVQASIDEKHIRNAHLGSFFLAGCITFALLLVPFEPRCIGFAVVLIASLVLLLKTPATQNASLQNISEEQLDAGSKFGINGSYIMFVDGVMIGTIAGMIVARTSKDVLPEPAIGILFLCVAAIFYLTGRTRPELLSLGKAQLVFMPIVACGIICAGFLDAPLNTLASVISFVALYIFDYANSSALAMRGSLISLSPCYCYAKGRKFIVLGQAAGWLMGAFVASDVGHGSLAPASLILLALVCVYVALATLNPDKYAIASFDAHSREIAPPPSKPNPIRTWRTRTGARKQFLLMGSQPAKGKCCSFWLKGATPNG